MKVSSFRLKSVNSGMIRANGPNFGFGPIFQVDWYPRGGGTDPLLPAGRGAGEDPLPPLVLPTLGIMDLLPSLGTLVSGFLFHDLDSPLHGGGAG